jgi:hypothetical protein
MDRCLYIFKEPLTQEDEVRLVRDVTAIDLKREVDDPFDLLPSIIGFIRDDINEFGITTYSLEAMKKTSFLGYRDKQPLYRLKLNNELMLFIERSSSLINKFYDVSSSISELDDQMRSYAYQLNEAMGVDARSFTSLGEVIYNYLIDGERAKLVAYIEGEISKLLVDER